MTTVQIIARIQELNVANHSLGQRYTGEMAIFNASAAMRNGKEMDEVRGRIHSCIDNMLDNNVTIQMLCQQYAEAMGREAGRSI